MKTAAPHATYEPMLCLLVDTLPEGEEWMYEIKWDGDRAIGYAASSGLRCKKAVVDGELVALGESGLPSFERLQNHRSHMPAVRYMLFDLLELNGRDLREKPLSERRKKLRQIIPANCDVIAYSQELPADPVGLMRGASAAGMEGIVAKRTDSKYEDNERSSAWQKWKAEREETFVVGGYMTPGTEILIGQWEGGLLRYVARVKAGFVARTKNARMKKLRPLVTDACPFYNLPEKRSQRFGDPMDAKKMEEATWAHPEIEIRVKFVEWTDSHHLRHAKFAGMV